MGAKTWPKRNAHYRQKVLFNFYIYTILKITIISDAKTVFMETDSATKRRMRGTENATSEWPRGNVDWARQPTTGNRERSQGWTTESAASRFLWCNIRSHSISNSSSSSNSNPVLLPVISSPGGGGAAEVVFHRALFTSLSFHTCSFIPPFIPSPHLFAHVSLPSGYSRSCMLLFFLLPSLSYRCWKQKPMQDAVMQPRNERGKEKKRKEKKRKE